MIARMGIAGGACGILDAAGFLVGAGTVKWLSISTRLAIMDKACD
ncbi:hypothetical protein [Iodidimonas gelatinilytica]|nr:hypothetical protein [Iodidimonas gelatinilytica]